MLWNVEKLVIHFLKALNIKKRFQILYCSMLWNGVCLTYFHHLSGILLSNADIEHRVGLSDV